MKSRASCSLLINAVIIMSFAFVSNTLATIVVYPSPPGLKTSPDFKITANDNLSR
jgi:hypothetical protein